MQSILDRAVKVFALSLVLFALLILDRSAVTPDAVAGELARTNKILDLIREVKIADGGQARKEKSAELADYIQETVKSGHANAVNNKILRGLGGLLDEPDDRFQVAIAIAEIGPRARGLAPKLRVVLREEYDKEQRAFMRQPVDAVDTICSALHDIRATIPNICIDRLKD